MQNVKFRNFGCISTLSSKICNFADDNTIYSCGKDLTKIIANLEIDHSRMLYWFAEIGMVPTPKVSAVSWIEYTNKTVP